jgi:spermidine synthase
MQSSETLADSGSPGEPAVPTALAPRLAAALVFLASGAVLVLEIVGLRLVAPYVGVTLQTSSAVIGVALGAIAYGAWTGGWLADRMSPRILLGPALVVAGIMTALVLPITRLVGEWLRGNGAASVLLLTMLTLFIPASVLSAITPLVIKTQLTDLRDTGKVVGRLSSIGTLGAITATLGTGFVLVAALPSSAVVLGLAGILALVGLMISGYDLRKRALTAAAVLTLGLIVVITPTPCEVETAYHCARVDVDPERPSGRTLVLNSGRHSYVDLNDPTHLEFGYAQWIGAAIDLMQPAAAPIRALTVGGGGFTLPMYIQAVRPGSDNLVLELDDRLVQLDKDELGLRTGPGMTVLTGDARVHLQAARTGSRDLVIGDAYGHYQIPWHLTTREVVKEIDRILKPGGMYAINVIDAVDGDLIKAITATIATVFPHVAIVTRPGDQKGRLINNVVYASRDPLPLDDLSSRLAVVPETGPLRTDIATFTKGAIVLTDDYAPVDRLRAL